MQLLILIPSLFIFLYCLYKLIKDDYVFMRKNVSAEQSFDVAFIVLLVSLFFSRLFFLLFHPNGENIFLSFFGADNSGFSFSGGILGGIVTLYLISKYKKYPLGRLADFFTAALLVALPFAFLMNALLHKKVEMLLALFNAAIYFLIALFFTRVLHPKLMHRKIKEGNITILFLLFFSLISFGSSFLVSYKKIMPWMDPQNIVFLVLLIFSLILFAKQELGKGKK